jgi:hypothetical protein
VEYLFKAALWERELDEVERIVRNNQENLFRFACRRFCGSVRPLQWFMLSSS